MIMMPSTKTRLSVIAVWSVFVVMCFFDRNTNNTAPQKSLTGDARTQYPGLFVSNIAVQIENQRWTTRGNESTGRVKSGIYNVPDDAIWVKSSATFTRKVSLFNDVIHNMTRSAIRDRGKRSWRQVSPPNKKFIIVAGNSPDYLNMMSLIPTVSTVLMDWTATSGNGSWTSTWDQSNLLIQDYYPITGSPQLCSRITGHEAFTHHRFETVFDNKCSSDISESFREESLELYVLNAVQLREPYYWSRSGKAWPAHFYTDVPRYVMYIHVIQDGAVDQLGQVYTDKYKIIPFNCRPDFKNADLPKGNANIGALPLHDEVFSISQFWGIGFYHKTLEDFPKLAPYVDFLRRNPTVKVHVYETGSYTSFIVRALGVDPSRLISGQVRANMMYLPRGTSCGFTHVQEAQLLSRHLRTAIPPHTDDTRNLVLIRRTQHRFFTQKSQIADKLKTIAQEFGLKFYLFIDNPVPPIDEAMREFNKAAMVVGPHGAGLSNLLYSKPGTMVVEGLCNPPHTNMCYTRLAHILGMRYHAVMSRGGCEGHVDVPAEEVASVVRNMLQEAKSRGEL